MSLRHGSAGAVAVALGSLVVTTPLAIARAPAAPAGVGGSVCTLIGCHSGVFLDAAGYLAGHATVQRVQVCALGRCRSTPRDRPALPGQPLVAVPTVRERTITITLTAFDRHGGVVLRRTLVARTRKAQPNGPHCQPVCFELSLVLSRRGVLTERR